MTSKKNTLTLREIQLAELDILVAFARFCDERGLTYGLTGGTLLGAVRHKGFIPWDDDIDVCMPRPDYEYLICLSDDFKRETGYEVAGHHDIAAAISPFVKVCDLGIAVEAPDLVEPERLWMDVFPVDGMESDLVAARKQCRQFEFLRLLLAALTSPVSSAQGMTRKLVKCFLKMVGSVVGKQRVAKIITARAQRIPLDRAEFAGHLVHTPYGVRERMRIESFLCPVELSFEGRDFKTLAAWDAYLTAIYGDYMQLPPEDKRATHQITAYRV